MEKCKLSIMRPYCSIVVEGLLFPKSIEQKANDANFLNEFIKYIQKETDIDIKITDRLSNISKRIYKFK